MSNPFRVVVEENDDNDTFTDDDSEDELDEQTVHMMQVIQEAASGNHALMITELVCPVVGGKSGSVNG